MDHSLTGISFYFKDTVSRSAISGLWNWYWVWNDQSRITV